MLRFAFTIASLAGPGVCCCSFAALTTASVSPTKSVKPCCQTDPRLPGEQGTQRPDPCKPSKCPCGRGKHSVSSLPTSGQGVADLVAQLKQIDAPLVGVFAPFGVDSSAVTTTRADTSPPAPTLAGRDLLAAYSTLRC